MDAVNWQSWANFQDKEKRVLCIGRYQFKKRLPQTYTDTIHVRDVLAALTLMINLSLVASTVTDETSMVTDTLMQYLKDNSDAGNSGAPISCNAFGKVNVAFARFVVDMISVQLVFNNWYPFLAQQVPAPFRGEETPADIMKAIKWNQNVIVSVLFDIDNSHCQKLFMTGKTVGWPVPPLKKLFSTVVSYKNKFEEGIISAWDIQDRSSGGKPGLWIHHWITLQFVHAKFAVPLNVNLRGKDDDGNPIYNFKHKNWTRFVRNVNAEMVANHNSRHSTDPCYGLVWLGKRM